MYRERNPKIKSNGKKNRGKEIYNRGIVRVEESKNKYRKKAKFIYYYIISKSIILKAYRLIDIWLSEFTNNIFTHPLIYTNKKVRDCVNVQLE